MGRLALTLSLTLLVLLTTPPAAGAERLPLTLYSVANGLAHNEIKSIVRDSRGFLWFATAEGLSRFDGYAFSNYGVAQGLPHGTVNALLETRDGEIWVGTNEGLAQFNPRGQPGNRIVPASDAPPPVAPMFTAVMPEDADRFARMVTVLLQTRDGTIWCGTLKRLYRLERHAGRPTLVPTAFSDGVLDLLEDRRGSLWIASFRGLFRRGRDGRLTQFTTRDGLPDNNIHDLLEDRHGQLWAGTRLSGFFRFTVEDDQSSPVVREVYGRQHGVPADWVFRLYETSDGRLWAGTNIWLVELQPASAGRRPLRTYARRHGLAFQEVTALVEDREGNLWLGTAAAGAMKLARYGFTTYDESDGLISVNAILEDATGDICFRGSVPGAPRSAASGRANVEPRGDDIDVPSPRFGRFDGRRIEWFTPGVAFDFGWLFEETTVRTVAGEWWVGSGAGLYRFPAAASCLQLRTARPIAV